MAYPAEHSARQADPDDFIAFKRKVDEFGPGVDVVYGIRSKVGPHGGRTEVQSLRFDARLFSRDEAKDWLAQNDFDDTQFMAAAGRANPSRAEQYSGLLDAADRYCVREGEDAARQNEVKLIASELRKRQYEALTLEPDAIDRANPETSSLIFGPLLLPKIEQKPLTANGKLIRYALLAGVAYLLSSSFGDIERLPDRFRIPSWLEDAAM